MTLSHGHILFVTSPKLYLEEVTSTKARSMDFTTWLMNLSATVLMGAAAAIGGVRLLPACDQLARARLGALTEQATRLLISVETMRCWLRLWCGIQVGLPILLWIQGMPLVGALAAFFVYIAPGHVLNFLIERRRMLLRDQLVPAIQGLANAAQAGLTLHQGLIEIERDTPRPLADEFRRILSDFHRGRPLRKPLKKFASV